ncbi:MAG: HAMP domain-containing sensor histidine kinase [Eubacteriales bacterium]|nr:HAMP domain-containing sensor histidine kinase [Eubacteriales bacterium]
MTSIKRSLTLRIFCMTGALLVAACGVTYGAIAYLTPISYTSLLADELKSEAEALLARLSASTPDRCQSLLLDFAKTTGADMRLVDGNEQVLYDTLPADPNVAIEYGDEACIVENRGDGSTDAQTTSTGGDETYVMENSGDNFAASQAASTIMEEQLVVEEAVISAVPGTQEYAPPDGAYAFTFGDGTSAFLTVQGGRRAVNQAAEAMKQILPFLLAVVAGISLLGSFFYARFITRPIVSISRIAKRIAALDFGARWREKRLDEIGGLGDSLNLLSDNLSGALSELQKANQSLRRDMERERELDRQRLAFFSAASHELKTPVTILKGQLSGMLAQVGVYRDREKYLARSLEVTGRMEGLIKEILTISRIESGSFSLSAAQVELGALVEKQLALDAELIEQKRLRLERSIEPGVLIRGSESLLANAIDNVLMNAILYSPAEATLRVHVGERRFSVENTGAFLPDEALPQLFTPFYRVEQSRNRKSGGSGLGLYLVKSILQLHGADCRMENTAGGVLFTARFAESAGG